MIRCVLLSIAIFLSFLNSAQAMHPSQKHVKYAFAVMGLLLTSSFQESLADLPPAKKLIFTGHWIEEKELPNSPPGTVEGYSKVDEVFVYDFKSEGKDLQAIRTDPWPKSAESVAYSELLRYVYQKTSSSLRSSREDRVFFPGAYFIDLVLAHSVLFKLGRSNINVIGLNPDRYAWLHNTYKDDFIRMLGYDPEEAVARNIKISSIQDTAEDYIDSPANIDLKFSSVVMRHPSLDQDPEEWVKVFKKLQHRVKKFILITTYYVDEHRAILLLAGRFGFKDASGLYFENDFNPFFDSKIFFHPSGKGEEAGRDRYVAILIPATAD